MKLKLVLILDLLVSRLVANVSERTWNKDGEKDLIALCLAVELNI